MFLPQLMRPVPRPNWLTNHHLRGLTDGPLSVLRARPGTYLPEALAAAIQDWDRWQHCVWLRTRTDRLAPFPAQLASACGHRWSDGHAGDAPAHRLEAILGDAPGGAVIVLEFEGRVAGDLGRDLAAIRPLASDRGVSLVVVTASRSPALEHAADRVVMAEDLTDPVMVSGSAVAAGLPTRLHDQLLGLAADRAAVLGDLLDATRVWPNAAIVDALDASRRWRVVVDRLTRNLLALCSASQREALEWCVATGYWHPQFATDAVQASALRPWIVPLEEQWGWLRPVWAQSLERHLQRPARQVRGHAPMGTAAEGSLERGRPAPAAHANAEARMLGAFEFRLDGVAVKRWPGPRGMSVLRYLLARPGHACSRDELIEEFWPDVAHDVARNRLQVAVSGLRRVLRDVTKLHVIEYAGGAYRINPAIRISVDAERFETALSAALGAERAGDPDRALAAYGEAIGLYRGDFAVDAPYEGWTLLPRESLRIKYVDALDRVCRLQLGKGRLDECIATAHRMLDVDPCREDAHRVLMRCYAKQGRMHQAIRQFEFCNRVMQGILGAAPSPQTLEMYRAIREGSIPEPSLID